MIWSLTLNAVHALIQSLRPVIIATAGLRIKETKITRELSTRPNPRQFPAAADSSGRCCLTSPGRGVRWAFRAPFADPDWPAHLALGGALNLLPLIGPTWTAGYAARYARSCLAGQPEWRLPAWDDWSGLFWEGLLVWTIALIWLAPGLLLLTLALPYLALTGLAAAGWLTSDGSFLGPALVLLVSGSILLLAGLAATPVSLLTYLQTKQFRAAFNRRLIGRTLRGRGRSYLATCAASAGPVLVLLVLALTPPGFVCLLLVGSFVSFYLTLVWAVLWADWGADNPSAGPV